MLADEPVGAHEEVPEVDRQNDDSEIRRRIETVIAEDEAKKKPWFPDKKKPEHF